MRVDAMSIARRYVEFRAPGHRLPTLVELELDESLCLTIADWYASAPDSAEDPETRRQYEILKLETGQQFEAMRRAGVHIRPWLEGGQPYKSSAHLWREVVNSGTLYVYLTSLGHGESGSTPDAVAHPMVEPSEYVIDGVRFAHNDVFRAVHDFFGHIARGNPFTAHGEHLAAWDHSHMYPADCHPVLLSETVSQICWFYYGPHLRDSRGRIPSPGSEDYVPPRDRPYSPQKTTPLPHELMDGFFSLFKQVN
ncbi:hypothetical protein [Streptomyces xanthophaeus]|uniref:hypothetical protein n=1 Tax=Streptomyces xanthophaeus TaxID=67385 RepID=UPI00364640A3